jgi:hypothetical protein
MTSASSCPFYALKRLAVYTSKAEVKKNPALLLNKIRRGSGARDEADLRK